jgi:hypothetical protein
MGQRIEGTMACTVEHLSKVHPLDLPVRLQIEEIMVRMSFALTV